MILDAEQANIACVVRKLPWQQS